MADKKEYIYVVVFDMNWTFTAPAPRAFRKSGDAWDCLWNYYLEKFGSDEDDYEKKLAEQELMDGGCISDVGRIEEIEVE